MRIHTLFAVVTLALLPMHAAAEASIHLVDVVKDEGRYFTIIQDDRDIFWLAEATPIGNSTLIGPIPGLLAEPVGESAAGSWRVANENLEYLAHGRKVVLSFNALVDARDRLTRPLEWFHAVAPNSAQPDEIGAPLAVAPRPSPLSLAKAFSQQKPERGTVAASGWLSNDCLMSALYMKRNGHLQVWKWSTQRERKVIEEHGSQELNEQLPPDADFLTRMAHMEILEPGWRIIVDQRLTLKPPMLMIDVPTGLFLIDNAGVAYAIENQKATKIGTFPDWSEVDERLLLREDDRVSLYARDNDQWQILQYDPLEDIATSLPAPRDLTPGLMADFESVMETRELLKREIPTSEEAEHEDHSK